jgi:hypothetical protein
MPRQPHFDHPPADCPLCGGIAPALGLRGRRIVHHCSVCGQRFDLYQPGLWENDRPVPVPSRSQPEAWAGGEP